MLNTHKNGPTILPQNITNISPTIPSSPESSSSSSSSAKSTSAMGPVQLDNMLSRLEHRIRPKSHQLSHDFGHGALCNRCGQCPGLDLHFWRKMCKVCCCRLDEHDVMPANNQDHGAMVTRNLFSQIRWENTAAYSSMAQIGIGTSNSSGGSEGGGGSHSKMSSSSASSPLGHEEEERIGRMNLGEEEEEENITIGLMTNVQTNGRNKEGGGGNEMANTNRNANAIGEVGIQLANNGSKPEWRSVVPPPLPSSHPSPPLSSPLLTSPPDPPPLNGIKKIPSNSIGTEKVIEKTNGKIALPEEFGTRREHWAWSPSANWPLAHRYLMSLPEADRPLLNRPGAQQRRQRLAQQLPYHDSDVAAGSNANRSKKEQQVHEEFIELIKHEVVGIAEVVDYGQHKAHFVTAFANSAEGSNCRQCSGEFDQSAAAVGIVTDHEREKPEAIWHPSCFTCSVCHQLLVDLLYFYRDGKYFCGRHFGEKLYPRCAGCDELIFANEYTFAEERSWHLEHFCCFGCDKHLSGQRYVVKEEQPYCVECYMGKFARTCLTCCQKIAPFDQRVSYGELHWHARPDCFKCKCCAKPLSNQQFLLKADQPFCSGECRVRFGF